MSPPRPTGSQTVGPFFGPALLRDDMLRQRLAGPGISGEPIRLDGQVRDGDGSPVPDAIVELWQANAQGRYDHPLDSRDLPLEPGFDGFGRAGTDDDGRYWFETIRPGPVPEPRGGLQAPHLVLTIHGRGLLDHLITRVYFADAAVNEVDPILASVPPHRRGTLIARRLEGGDVARYTFDVVLQGPDETVFFRL